MKHLLLVAVILAGCSKSPAAPTAPVTLRFVNNWIYNAGIATSARPNGGTGEGSGSNVCYSLGSWQLGGPVTVYGTIDTVGYGGAGVPVTTTIGSFDLSTSRGWVVSVDVTSLNTYDLNASSYAWSFATDTACTVYGGVTF